MQNADEMHRISDCLLVFLELQLTQNAWLQGLVTTYSVQQKSQQIIAETHHEHQQKLNHIIQLGDQLGFCTRMEKKGSLYGLVINV